MKVSSIHIGKAQPLKIGNRVRQSAILKSPVDAASVQTLGLVGDVQVNKKHHGGVDQAVYIYSTSAYSFWEDVLDQRLDRGVFGENFIIEDFDHATICVGDRFVFEHGVIVEVTSPRIPCSALPAAVGVADMVKQFKTQKVPGLYARVIETGDVKTGEAVVHQSIGSLSILELYELMYEKITSIETLEMLLSHPIDIRNRTEYSKQLAALRRV